MMTPRTALAIVLLLGGPSGLGGPCVAAGAPPAPTVRVGFLTHTRVPPLLEGFRQGLRDVGLIEGRDVTLEYRSADGHLERLPGLATELVRRRVDLILVTSLAVQAARAATTTVPIVFVTPDDPEATGLVSSLAHPGGNLTGLASLNVELDGKRLALLKEAVPGLRRVAVLSSPVDPTAAARLAAAEAAARSVGLTLQQIDVRDGADVDGAIAAVGRGGAGALSVLGSARFFTQQPRMAMLAARARLAAISPWREFPEAGGLMSYGADVAGMFRRAAVYVDKILKGARPADLPVEQPTRFELVVNLRAARALGLAIPPSLLLRADAVLQ